jgi:uncharacterized membrane protein YfcA
MPHRFPKKKNILIGLIAVPISFGILIGFKILLPEDIFPIALIGFILIAIVLQFLAKRREERIREKEKRADQEKGGRGC